MWNKIKFNLILKYQWLAHFLSGNDGYIEEPIKDTDYIMGASPLIKKVLQEDSNWTPFIPPHEKQRGRTETMACVSFGLLNTLEILAKRKWGEDWNKSDRYTAKISNTSRNGNLMSRVIDNTRKVYGTVDQTDWENNIDEFTWTEFYAQIPQAVTDKGKMWLKDYEIGYEGVYAQKQALIEALKFSPLWLAVSAWYERDGVYIRTGNPNHVCVGILPKPEGMVVLDQYEPFIKTVAWDNIFYPKIVTISKKKQVFNQEAIQKLIARGLEYIIRPESHGELYRLSEDGLAFKEGQALTNDIIREKQAEGKIVGVSEKTFYSLLI